MKSRIGLATGLVLLAALGVVAFQAYWTYQTYQQATRRLRQDGQSALAAANQRALAAQQNRLLARYAGWLQDTTHIRISCHINRYSQQTEFIVAGIPARPTERTGVSFEEFKPRLTHLTPAARAWFIRRFAFTTVRRELNQGFVVFHTQWLGKQLVAAQRQVRTSPAELSRLLATELRQRGLAGLPFYLRLGEAGASDSLRLAPAGFGLALEPARFGQRRGNEQVARVWLPAGPGPVLRQLQGGLAASGMLVLLVLGGAGYAVGTMRRQRQLAALKADFTHNLTHELKTPVATIQLAADSLRLFAPDARTSAEYAALIGEQAGRLGTLIDRILQSVALERAALPLARKPVALLILGREVVAQHRPLFEQAGRQLGWEAPAAAITVLGDATHLGSTLATLLDNALHYGGPHVCLQAELRPTEVRLHVHDNGPGIAPAHQERIFEQFFRVPTGNLHTVKGYGLGLYYARQIAQAHGGSLTVRSQPGRGTTFTLALPRAEANQPVAAGDIAASQPAVT